MNKFSKKRVIVILILLLAVRTAYKYYIFNYKYNEWKREKRDITVVKVKKVTNDSVTYIGLLNREKVIFSLKDVNNVLDFGDKICVICSNYKIEKMKNPYEFDYKRYLNSNDITLRIFVENVLNIEKSNNVISKLRNIISNVIVNNLKDKAEIVKSLMYGDDTYLDENFKEKCKNIGIGHIMCLSGTHVMFLTSIFSENIKRKHKRIINFFLVLYLYVISLFELSLLRIVIMYLINLFFEKMKYSKKMLICLYLILTINPYYIFNIGIIFSFLSIISIKLFNPIISSFLIIKLHIKNRFLITNISASISSIILILPFSIYFFNCITPIMILSNILLSITVSYLIRCIFYSFLVIYIPFLSNILLKVVYYFVSIFCFQIDILYKINIFNFSLPKIPFWIFILYYFSLFLAINKSKIAILYFWKYRKFIKIFISNLIALNFAFVIIWYVLVMKFESYVIFFNVGQGNMCLIHKNNINILVDCGSTQENIASNILINFLKAKNINRIDLILITHFHEDHINGIEGIISNGIKIKNVGYTIPYKDIQEYIDLKKVLKENNIGIISLEQGDSIKINDILFNILTPPKDKFLSDSDMLNANSTVILCKFNKKKILFMGDSTKVTEKYILDNYVDILNNVDIYQVSHHGSKTSSLKEFLCSIHISNAVISAKREIYGHPDKEVIEILDDLKIKKYITQNEGAIIF